MPECIPLYTPGQEITGHATANVVGKTFADVSADIQTGLALGTDALGGNIQVATCAAGARPIGAFKYDQASGQKVGLLGPGHIAPLTAGAGITAGQEVEVGSAGKPIPLATGRPAGKAVSTATTGNDVLVRIY